MSVEIKLLTEAEYTTTTWSGGKTTQLFIYPEEADYSKRDFKFRLSSATIEVEESEFTRLDSVYRFITPLDGQLKLTHDQRHFVELQPFDVYEFDGGKDTTSFGKAKDFNLMLKDGAEGSLESVLIDKETRLNYSFAGKEFFLFLYASNEPVTAEVQGKTYNLKPDETLLINGRSVPNLQIKLNSEDRANVLVAKIDL
ncbi:MAG: HutD family protein [Firmicutes bacterium]|jgi:environmental stress-induced protein Ves|nr:HutD family protein [Bacillota bacterium]